MQVETVSHVLGWFWGDHLRTENRTVYHYEKGNDVTVVDVRDYTVQLYSRNGEVETHNQKHSVDVRV